MTQTSMPESLAKMAAMPISEMGLGDLLRMADTISAALSHLSPMTHAIGTRLCEQARFDPRVVELVRQARNNATAMHDGICDANMTAHVFYDGYVRAGAEGVRAPGRDNLIATQQGG